MTAAAPPSARSPSLARASGCANPGWPRSRLASRRPRPPSRNPCSRRPRRPGRRRQPGEAGLLILDTEFNSAAQVPARQCLEGAMLAERRGFGCVWKGESNSRDPIVLLSAMAARTTRLELGTAIYHMFGRSPVSLGIQAATFNDLSQGRLILGLGIANPTIAGWHGYEFDRPVRQLREYIDVIRRVYSGDRTEYSGDFYRISGFKLAFEPPPYRLRIWLAALGPQMTRLAGRVSDGIVINLASPPMIKEIVAGFRDAALEAGRDPDQPQLVSKLRVSIHPDIDQARRALKKVLTFYTLAYG